MSLFEKEVMSFLKRYDVCNELGKKACKLEVEYETSKWIAIRERIADREMKE